MNKKVWKFYRRFHWEDREWDLRSAAACIAEKQNQNRASPPELIPFPLRHLLGWGGGWNCSWWKSFSPGAPQDLSSQDFLEILPPRPKPTLGRGQRCLAGDLSKGRWRWRGRFASTKEHHGVKSHLQCYLTFPVPVVFLVLRQSWGLCKMKCATSKLPPALGRTLTTLWKAKFTVGRTSVHAFFGYSMVFLKITTSFHNFIISWINFTISYSCYPNHFPSPHPQETRPMNSSIWGNSPISEKWKEKLTYFLLMLSYEGKKEM